MAEDRDLNDWLGNGAFRGADAPTGFVRQRGSRRRWAGVGLVAAGAVAGGILAGALGASAASSSSGTPAAYGYGYGSATNPGPGTGAPRNTHGSAPVRSDEKAVSASLTATLTQKAKAAVPGGTVYRVETDAGDAAYEAHMTKADGTEVTVKFDKNLKVTGVETRMGKGDPNTGGPGGPGGPGGHGDHDGDGPGGPGRAGSPEAG
jgi:hypothetical protein